MSSDMTFLRNLADTHDARLITTEKDFVRLPKDWREGILAWPIEARFHDTPVTIDKLLKSTLDTFHNGS